MKWPDRDPVTDSILCFRCKIPIVGEMILKTTAPNNRECFCEPCAHLLDDERVEKRWRQFCPQAFLSTDIRRLPANLQKFATAWNPTDASGLLLAGPTGCGKTRTSWEILRRAFFAKKSIVAVTAYAFARACADQFSSDEEQKQESRTLLDDATAAQLLFFDDLGKFKITERLASELFALVDSRTANSLPTIWTTNFGPEELARALGGNAGAPTLRRIEEFSECVQS